MYVADKYVATERYVQKKSRDHRNKKYTKTELSMAKLSSPNLAVRAKTISLSFSCEIIIFCNLGKKGIEQFCCNDNTISQA